MPATKFTGARLERLAEYKALRPFIGITEYNNLIAKLSNAQKVADRKAAEAAARREARIEAKRIEREAELKRIRSAAAKKAAATRAANRIPRVPSRRDEARQGVLARVVVPVGANIDGAEVYQIATEIARLNPAEFRLRFYANGELIRETVIIDSLFGSRTRRIHEYIRRFFTWEGSDGLPVFWTNRSGADWPAGTTLEVIVSASTEPIAPVRMAQRFADGVKHCVAEPLAAVWEKYAENATTDESRKKMLRTARQIRAYGERYAEGIPEGEAMEEMARIARRHIIITDIFNEKVFEYNVKSPKQVRFINAKPNHVEVGQMCMGNKAEKCTQEEMLNLIADHQKRLADNKEFYMFEGPASDIRCIRSAHGAWRVENPLHDIYEKHNKDNNIHEFGLDAVRFPDVNAFLKCSALVNSIPVKLSDRVPTQHHDLKAAYTQHALTPRYEGFMGKIHQWRNVTAVDAETVLSHLCICEFEVLAVDGLLARLGLRVGGRYVLPSPEIKLMRDMGAVVRLINAVFGSKTDLKYGEEIMAEKAYATWAGCMSHDRRKKEYNFKGDRHWAAHLATLYGAENVRFNVQKRISLSGDEEECNITVLVDKKFNYTMHHILAFITSYTRINVIEALMKIKTPCHVVLDGIYHCDDDVVLPCEFREKPAHAPAYFGEWYVEAEREWTFPACDVAFLSNCVLAGAGGSGKTHSIMTDAGFNRVLYAVPQHILGQSMYGKYGTTYATIHALLGIGGDGKPTQSLRDKGMSPAVCLIDELTMIPASWISQAIADYPHTRFLIAGDIDSEGRWFQCRSGSPGKFAAVWKGEGCTWKHYGVDHRSRDEDLKVLKLRLREAMRRVFTNGEAEDAQKIADWVVKNYKVVNYTKAIAAFVDGDTWIAGTHRTNQMLLDAGIVSGYKSPDNNKTCGYSEPTDSGKKWEKRGAFTTHSFQGQTVTDGKIYVSIDDAFEYAMIYTAASRAVSFDQIVFVDK
jgi:hypothetical protein